ncbi:hypothetical protein PUN28_015356 [Cardiocondyla obscurior]|uniref:Uncharacterized protein n=1 Tax=Cardiocondyla obscurior TaxID=286306 RepID=A0AAW2ESK9_9HYME
MLFFFFFYKVFPSNCDEIYGTGRKWPGLVRDATRMELIENCWPSVYLLGCDKLCALT